ncbi:MAG TPA: TIGR02300 family protein [Rhizomicrobium sp.]|jgi:uncharacterized protein (TIGR02300 family)|nr:TIGR02300 family protein [Rhizomicrobium sp.]
MTLVKADLGTKRVCPSCSARFYDLQKRPIECPKCAFTFEPEALYKQRRPRPEPEKAAGEPLREEAEELQEAEETEAEDVDEAASEEVAVLEESDEDIIEGEEEEKETAGMTVVDPAEQGGEIEEIEEEAIAEEDVEDPALLEQVGEEEEDVSGIIDAGIDKDER